MTMRLDMWINAFIPKDVAGYTQALKTGAHIGKTAIPIPAVARLMNFQASGQQGYMTDQRGFNSDVSASVRMQSRLHVLIEKDGITVFPHRPSTSGTTGVDLATGKVNGQADANMGKCRATVFPVGPQQRNIITKLMIPPSARAVSVDIFGAGTDPLVNFAAEINYGGTFQVVVDDASKEVTVNFSGKIDDFPAFEAYAMCNGRVNNLFEAEPPKGNTVMNLLGGAKRPVVGSAMFRMT